MANIKNLKYLDLKGNNLKPHSSKVAGGCLNSKGHQDPAKNVSNYMRHQNHQKEKAEAFKLKKEKEMEATRLKKEEEKLARKKAEKKAAKEKKRLQKERGKERSITQNGAVFGQNCEMATKISSEKNPRQPNATVKKASEQWSYLGYVNVILLVALICLSGIFLILYTEGDLSYSGLKVMWPRVRKNLNILYNKTNDYMKTENIKATSKESWKFLEPIIYRIYNFLLIASQMFTKVALSVYSYLDSAGVIQYFKLVWDLCLKYIFELAALIQAYLLKIDWDGIFLAVRWTVDFVVKQFYVLREDLYRNEAMMSLWRYLQPVRSSLSYVFTVIMDTLSSLLHEIYITYLPFLRNQSVYVYHSVKTYIEDYMNN